MNLVTKKVEGEKSRKEPQTIYEKTMRLKQRMEDRRKTTNTTIKDETNKSMG